MNLQEYRSVRLSQKPWEMYDLVKHYRQSEDAEKICDTLQAVKDQLESRNSC